MNRNKAGSPTNTVTAENWMEEEVELKDSVMEWIRKEIYVQEKMSWQGGHDEGTFAYSWFMFYVLSGDCNIAMFLKKLKDDCLKWMSKTDLMHHGYWKQMDVHHGTELFNNFLAQYIVFDSDKRIIEAFENVAHHIGNWIQDIPEWYDRHKRMFKSEVLGTERIEPLKNRNFPSHFRLAQVLLETYIATGKKRYLNLCVDYVDHWTEKSETTDLIPLYLTSAADESSESRLKTIEEHVANNTLNILMDLYLLTGKENYLKVVRKAIPFLLKRISDSNNNASASIIAKYRSISRDKSFDDEIVGALKLSDEVYTSALLIFDSEWENKPHPLELIGRRRDEPIWAFRRINGEITEDKWSPPAHLMLASWIKGDENLATLALWKAKVRFKLAVINLRLGRQHGCAANTVSSVVAGHGRSFPHGNITSTLFPAVFGGFHFLGWYKYQIRYYHYNGQLGIPNKTGILFFPAMREENKILIHNMRESSLKLRLEILDRIPRRNIVLEHRNLKVIKRSKGHITIEVPPNVTGELKFL
ncbi:TPA: hypothetical protein EYP70_06065 [Candidatus Bathyarchaeota archaeon]|nr:hypothetical protein [Candidatus Bathyarchaeota archaeon]